MERYKLTINSGTITLIAIFIKQFMYISGDQYYQEQLAKNMTLILDTISNSEIYDKRLRPNYGGPPVDVFIFLHVSKLGAVSELNMDFTLDIDIKQTWTDPRLRWKGVPIEEIRIKDDQYLKSIWVPDTYFPNEKRAAFHRTTVNQIYVHITNKGNVTTRQRLTITATCAMFLWYFPLDSQTCKLVMESYGYTTDDIRLFWWQTETKTPVKLQKEIRLATFELGPLDFEETTFTLATGVYSQLHCYFKLERVLQYYWIQIYQPSILVVMVSWVAFWINRDSAPARVTLGITTVLTMTTLMSSTNQQMPKVSYVKAMDVYLVVCYIMVFAALLEYAVVSYSNKKKQDMNRKKVSVAPNMSAKQPENENVSSITGRFGSSPQPVASSGSQSTLADSSYQQPDLVFHTIKQSPNMSRPLNIGIAFPTADMNVDDMPRIELNKVASIKKTKSKKVLTFNDRIKGLASSVDKYSRIIFPAVFTIFNVIYWLFYLYVSGKFDK